MGYWASGGGGGYEEYEYYLIWMMDNGLDEGHDNSHQGFFGMGKASPMMLCMYVQLVRIGKGSRYVMGHNTKRRTSKVALDYALVMINAAVIACHVSLLPLIFFSSTGSRVISGYVVSVLLSRGLRDMFQ